MTATALDPTDVTPDVDDVVHLVCSCQLYKDGRPLALPVLAFCGWECQEPEPSSGAFWRRPCSMCLQELSCPACGGGA